MHVGFTAAVAALDAGIGSQHAGYQLYVSVWGETLLDHAGGTSRPGVAMTPHTLTQWFSSSKPLTAVAIGQLWEQGKLRLDDPVVTYLPDFRNGKETATIRQLLTHTAGFPWAIAMDRMTEPWNVLIRAICAAPAEWQPGTAAGYHPVSAHYILGELIRLIDGRPVERYVREQVCEPLGMMYTYLGIPDELLPELRDAVAAMDDPVSAILTTDPYLQAVSPGMSGRGPAHDLGRLFEVLLGGGQLRGTRILSEQTVAALTTCHRRGLEDRTFMMPGGKPLHAKWGYAVPWGLGFELDGNTSIGARNSPRVFGHTGGSNAAAFADPESGLTCVIVTNGFRPQAENAERLSRAADLVNDALAGAT